MPFVASAEALNARLTRVPFDEPLTHEGLYRVPLFGSPAMRLVLLEFPAGFRTIPHRHPNAHEWFLVVGGSGQFMIGDGAPTPVGPGDLLLAQIDEVHAIEAGPAGLRFLAGVGPNEDRRDEEINVAPLGDGRP